MLFSRFVSFTIIFQQNRKNGSSRHFVVRRIVQRVSDRTSVFLGGKLHQDDQRSSDYLEGNYIIIMIFNNVLLRSIIFWFSLVIYTYR